MQSELIEPWGAAAPNAREEGAMHLPMMEKSQEESQTQPDNLYQDEFLKGVFDAIPAFVFIVDNDVRLHFWNAPARNLVGHDPALLYLKKGGEALHCIYSIESRGGCGWSKYCRECVIRSSVSKSFTAGETSRGFTRLQRRSGDTIVEVYLLVTASPFHYKEKEYALLLIEDVSHLLDESLNQAAEPPAREEPAVTLTGCEREILLWLKEGKSSWDISQILDKSMRTVNYHIYNIIQKLEAMNRTQAVAIAIKMGLIPAND